MNMLQHGIDVHDWYRDLYIIILGLAPHKNWRLPEWIAKINLRDLRPFDIMQIYQYYHDCGKPLCRTVDDKGRQHFPDHAQISSKIWLDNSDGSRVSLETAELIAMDMDVHTIRGSEIESFISSKYAKSLILTGLCEIHSNAIASGGGLDSTSFKIKWKQIDRIGRRLE